MDFEMAYKEWVSVKINQIEIEIMREDLLNDNWGQIRTPLTPVVNNFEEFCQAADNMIKVQ